MCCSVFVCADSLAGYVDATTPPLPRPSAPHERSIFVRSVQQLGEVAATARLRSIMPIQEPRPRAAAAPAAGGARAGAGGRWAAAHVWYSEPRPPHAHDSSEPERGIVVHSSALVSAARLLGPSATTATRRQLGPAMTAWLPHPAPAAWPLHAAPAERSLRDECTSAVYDLMRSARLAEAREQRQSPMPRVCESGAPQSAAALAVASGIAVSQTGAGPGPGPGPTALPSKSRVMGLARQPHNDAHLAVFDFEVPHPGSGARLGEVPHPGSGARLGAGAAGIVDPRVVPRPATSAKRRVSPQQQVLGRFADTHGTGGIAAAGPGRGRECRKPVLPASGDVMPDAASRAAAPADDIGHATAVVQPPRAFPARSGQHVAPGPGEAGRNDLALASDSAQRLGAAVRGGVDSEELERCRDADFAAAAVDGTSEPAAGRAVSLPRVRRAVDDDAPVHAVITDTRVAAPACITAESETAVREHLHTSADGIRAAIHGPAHAQSVAGHSPKRARWECIEAHISAADAIEDSGAASVADSASAIGWSDVLWTGRESPAAPPGGSPVAQFRNGVRENPQSSSFGDAAGEAVGTESWRAESLYTYKRPRHS